MRPSSCSSSEVDVSLLKFDLAMFKAPHSSGQCSGDCFTAVASNLSWTQSRLSKSLYALKEFDPHLLGLRTPATELGLGFCEQHLEFTSSLQSKYYPGPMLLNFSVQMGTGVSNMTWSDSYGSCLWLLISHKATALTFVPLLQPWIVRLLIFTLVSILSLICQAKN